MTLAWLRAALACGEPHETAESNEPRGVESRFAYRPETLSRECASISDAIAVQNSNRRRLRARRALDISLAVVLRAALRPCRVIRSSAAFAASIRGEISVVFTGVNAVSFVSRCPDRPRRRGGRA